LYAQTAIILLLVEMDRKSKEDAEKQKKSEAEKARTNELHERHLQTESYLRRQHEEFAQVIRQIDGRLSNLENRILHPPEDGRRWRWLF